MAEALAHTTGADHPPLLEQTIGDNLDETATEHATREALVEVATGRRWPGPEHDAVDLDAPAAATASGRA